MPKLPCPCGYVHDLSPIPDGGWITVRDSDYEELGEGVLSATERHGLLYECPDCGCLLWQPPSNTGFRLYHRHNKCPLTHPESMPRSLAGHAE
jgi:hypothetical protein